MLILYLYNFEGLIGGEGDQQKVEYELPGEPIEPDIFFERTKSHFFNKIHLYDTFFVLLHPLILQSILCYKILYTFISQFIHSNPQMTTSEIIIFLPSVRRSVYSFSLEMAVAVYYISGTHFVNHLASQLVGRSSWLTILHGVQLIVRPYVMY